MAAHPLQVEHPVRQAFIRRHFTLPFVGNGPILTEDAAEITV
jgi:hypothetical protein